MGEENIEDQIQDQDYWLALYSLDYLMQDLYKAEAYELINKVDKSRYRISEDYILFRLDKYDSEGRKVIREVYNVLGYNPNVRSK